MFNKKMLATAAIAATALMSPAAALASGGASAIRQLRTGNVDLPIYGGSAFDGTFWTSAIPNLSNFYNVAMASSAGDDPNPAVNDFIKNLERHHKSLRLGEFSPESSDADDAIGMWMRDLSDALLTAGDMRKVSVAKREAAFSAGYFASCASICALSP